jgi:hypothetical protein
MIFCTCGQRMRTSPEHGRRIYRCASRETAAGPCGGSRVPADDVEAWAWEEVAARLQDPTLVAAEAERARSEGPDATLVADLESLRRSSAKIERQQERLIAKYRQSDDEEFPWELVEREIARAQQEKADLQQAIDDAERRLAEQQSAVVQLEALASYCERVSRNLATFGFVEKRDALEGLGVRVEANGWHWGLEGRIPLADDAGKLTTTCCSAARPGPARPCWREPCRRSCPD